jgi:ADP-L-glycero-D-manno-heptose 6-epimerase
MIVVTGAAGFIGSAMVWKLNQEGIRDVLIVDQPGIDQDRGPIPYLQYAEFLGQNQFLELVREDRVPTEVEAVVHMGACSATTEQNREYLRENNTEYTRHLAEWAVRRGVRFLYASSAATYGDGGLGFRDDDETTRRLRPLNPYGESKQQFDLWALEQGLLDRIAGVKFFNVFGPNEYEKGPMISGAYRAFLQIQETGRVSLFRSDHPEYRDGEQRRDFVYVKDCVEVLWWFLRNPGAYGLFNVGTGQARTWNDLAHAVFAALGRPPRIEYVPAPDSLRAAYQYWTQADLTRLRSVGCDHRFLSLEDAVTDYVQNHLLRPNPWLEGAS